MAVVITHATVAADPQSPLLDHTDWNANHVVTGLDAELNSKASLGLINMVRLGATIG